MSTPLELAKKFITQAVDPAATEAEARTFAFKAAKLIAEHKLLEGPEATLKEKAVSFWKTAPVERVMAGLSTAAIAAASYEVIELRTENERLKERIRTLKKRLMRR
jgi:hypothetical protein